MKKLFICIIMAATLLFTGNTVLAAEAPLSNAPYLNDISFSNAEIDGGFRQGETFFTLTLNDPSESAQLDQYSINGNGNIFVTYKYDDSNHQTGIIVTLTFSSGSVIYTFNYANAESYKVSGNANLTDITCEYGELQPQMNPNDTAYKLYIPADLTQLNITPVTEDINAYCAVLPLELRAGQETEIPLTVTASDSSTKKYTLKIKRVNKTVEEVKAEMAQPGFSSFVDGELFYQKPVFIIAVGAVAGGLITVFILAAIIKRITINPYDEDEKPFYSPVE